jgi:hypothetical protein
MQQLKHQDNELLDEAARSTGVALVEVSACLIKLDASIYEGEISSLKV